MSERFVDPNSGAAPQPGGMVAGGASQPAAPKGEDPVLDHERETQAGPAGEQPAEAGGEQTGEQTGEPKGDPDGEPTTEEPSGEPTTTEEPSGEPESKDYSELLDGSVPDVEKYLDAHPEEKEAVIAAEQQREKPRKGITEL